MSEFRVQESGFQIVLDNGYTVSVQFGEFHYCSSRHALENSDAWLGLHSKDAEVAVRDRDGEFVALTEDEDVKGYQSVSEVIALINKFNQLKEGML